MKYIFRDSLFVRLFLLMLSGLIISHVVAYYLTPQFLPENPQGSGGAAPFPQIMSLPPGGPELLSEIFPPDQPPHPLAPPPPPSGEFSGPGRGENLWLIDMAIRTLVIAIFAGLGASWLSRPVYRLVRAAKKISRPEQRYRQLPLLPDQRGMHEIRTMAAAFNGMTQSLRVQLETRELFLAAVAHDLRTPMSRLRMHLEKLQDRHLIDECMSEFNAMTALLESAIESARIGHQQTATQMIDVYALVQARIDDLQAENKDVELDGYSCIARLPVDTVQRVLDNLLTNAIRYGGSAQVSVNASKNWITLIVNDRGPGIPEDQLYKVFEPFHRLEQSRNRKTGGVGLGLYISRELMHACGGRIELANRPSGGLSVTLSFPVNATPDQSVD